MALTVQLEGGNLKTDVQDMTVGEMIGLFFGLVVTAPIGTFVVLWILIDFLWNRLVSPDFWNSKPFAKKDK